jgi:anti-sigma factor RsiW
MDHLRHFPTKVALGSSARILLVVITRPIEEATVIRKAPTVPNYSGRPTRVVGFRDLPAQESPVIRLLTLFRDIFCLALPLP